MRYISKKAYLKICSILAIIALIGLASIGNYGVCVDEETHIKNVKYNYDLITKDEPIPIDLKYYGIIFDVTAETVFQVQKIFKEGFAYNPIKDDDLLNNEPTDRAIAARIPVKHLLTFLLSLVAYISVAGMVGILAGFDYAWLGSLILALFPRFWGHSFFNPKDIPLAAMFTLGTFLGACLVDYYLKAPRKNIKLGINRITLYSLLYGVLVGLTTGTRIGGFFLLFFVPLTHLLISLGIKSISNFLRFWSLYGLMLVAWTITTTIIHPASWSNPVRWFVETLQYLSKHQWPNTVLFKGQQILASSLPWDYLPRWLVITIPLIFQITFLIGLLLIVYKYKALTSIQRACVILVSLQIFVLPGIAILKQSTMYDGMRQFLFMLPGIAVFSATALAWIYQMISRKSWQIFASMLTIVLLSPIVLDMIAFHPYEYIYFNRLSGGLIAAENQYETDYWGLSVREAMEWLNHNVTPNAIVATQTPFLSKIAASPKLDLIVGDSKQFYYVALPRWDFQSQYPKCPVVYSVKRQGVPLTIIKKCDGLLN